MDEYEVIHVPSEYIFVLSKGLGDLENHLEKDPKMARATRVINEIKYMVGKDQTCIELLASLSSLTEACALPNNPNIIQGATFEDHERQLGMSMPPTSMYMVDVVPSINIPSTSKRSETIKANRLPLGFSFTHLVTSSDGGFGGMSGGRFGSGGG